MLLWIPAYLQHFDDVYILDDIKTDLFTHELWNL